MISKSHVRAFSLVELMVVISIIVILISFILPGLKSASAMVDVANCANNERLLVFAWQAYADEHNGQIAYMSNEGSGNGSNSDGWVLDPRDVGDNENVIKGGALWPYTQDISIYQCPNSVMEYWADYVGCGGINADHGWNTAPWYNQIMNISSIIPDQQMVFLEEADPRDRNWGSWVIEPYPSWTWVDYPAVYHNGGDNVAFADGHVEHWKYVDRRTIAFSDSYTDFNFGYRHDGNEDLRRYQKVYNPQRDNASRKNTSFGSRNTQ